MRSVAVANITNSPMLRRTNSSTGDDEKPAQSTRPTSTSSDSLQQLMLKYLSENIPEANVTDFWESFRDGHAFAIIINHLCPNALDMEHVQGLGKQERLEFAFAAAEEELGIPSLVPPEQFEYGGSIDEGAVQNYVRTRLYT